MKGDRNWTRNHERTWRVPRDAPIGQRQLPEFFRGPAGELMVRVVSEHDRTNVPTRIATHEDRSRFDVELARFLAEEAAR